MFIVELEEEVWIAPWEGDPGRTLVKENAKRFKSKGAATKAMDKACAIRFRDFKNAQVILA